MKPTIKERKEKGKPKEVLLAVSFWLCSLISGSTYLTSTWEERFQIQFFICILFKYSPPVRISAFSLLWANKKYFLWPLVVSCLYLILGNFHDVLVTYLHLSEKESCVFVDAHLFGSHSMDVQQNNCSVPCENRWSCFPISRFLSLHSLEFRLLQSQNWLIWETRHNCFYI